MIHLKSELSSGKVEAQINITGRVQGVGFRPFIYRIAIKNNLVGYVINLGDAGVEIEVEGKEKQIRKFIEEIEDEAPRVSEIEKITYQLRPYRARFEDFIIDKSHTSQKVASGIYPPDIGICPDCLKDMNTPTSRWYEYPFTACAWCGPRFTAVKSLPYDRERTHMHDFPMCEYCTRDYNNPLDRRFDAQGITCKLCGPKMSLFDTSKQKIETEDVFYEAAKLLKKGKIIAVKGIGGFHLATLATSDDAIEELRHRKNRPFQPFALMSPDLESIKKFTEITTEEEKILQSWRKPIVLLKKNGQIISDKVAPGLNRVGVMLPYSGIQTLLFKRLNEPALIMTSGNQKGLPMSITNEAAFNELGKLADYFLLHNREIVNRTDDSVIRIIDGIKSFTRRSRGYVPDPIEIPLTKGISVSLGAELRNTAAVTLKGKSFLTQYLGDIDHLENLEFEKQAIKTMCDLLNITRNPDVYCCDLHPQYLTSQYAEVISQELDIPLVKSQHHHAHIVSVMAENNVKQDEEILGIALDGAGYGINGFIWGGEVLKSTYSGFERLGHLEELPMPGGDLCSYYPFRIVISALTNCFNDDDTIRDITENHINNALPHGKKEFDIVVKQSRSSNTLKTSSSGRFLDAIATIIGLTYNRTYEGEPAMRLEAAALKGQPSKINQEGLITHNKGKYILKTSDIIKKLILGQNIYKKSDIAAYGQYYLSKGICDITKMISEETGIRKIGLSGGVFANEYITKKMISELKDSNLEVLLNKNISSGDGGVALGQACLGLSTVI